MGYFQAVALLQAPIEEYLRTHAPRATCIVSDFCHPWTSALAASLGVPRLSFLAIPALSALCELEADQVDEPVMVPVPGWKKRVQLTRDQTARFFSEPCWRAVHKEIYGAQDEVDGMILTSHHVPGVWSQNTSAASRRPPGNKCGLSARYRSTTSSPAPAAGW